MIQHVISISGQADTGAIVSGRVISFGPGGAIVEVMGLGTRFISADRITRVFCKSLGGRITFDDVLNIRP